MATLMKALRISNNVTNITKLFTNLSLNINLASTKCLVKQTTPSLQRCFLHTTSKQSDLMEFFDEKKYWGENKVQVGRSWNLDELRIKSNEDLHKLWYVLLKENNMLITMEKACHDACEIFPNPERIDKVKTSMKNLETIVRERNEAYFKLEVGHTGEQPSMLISNEIGLKVRHRLKQYHVPKFMNTKWHEEHKYGYSGRAVPKFLSLLREKLWNIKRRERNRNTNRVLKLLRKFPNMDMDSLKAAFPGVNYKRVLENNKIKGHFAPDERNLQKRESV